MELARTMSLARHNPLRCAGTALPPNLLLAAKLVFLCLVLKGYVRAIPEPFLPMLSLFDQLPRPDLVRLGLQTMFVTGGLAVWFNLAPRLGAFAAGAALLLAILGARTFYTNGTFFCAALLMLTGLYQDRRGLWLLRAQFVVMYFGSALNKLLEPDWRDGRYFDHWLGTLQGSVLYDWVDPFLPPLFLATALGWSVIAGEFFLVIALAVPRLQRAGVWTAIVMHTVSVTLAQQDFSVFFSALLVSFLVFAEWPLPGTVAGYVEARRAAEKWFERFASRLDLDGMIRWMPLNVNAARPPHPRLVFGPRGRVYHGLAALNATLLLLPAVYYPLTALVAASHVIPYKLWLAAVWCLVLWFFPATSWLASRRSPRTGAGNPDATCTPQA
jgi:hypothetical protein